MSRPVLTILLTAVLAVSAAHAAPKAADKGDIERLIRTLRPNASPLEIRNVQTKEGYFRYVGAPADSAFELYPGKASASLPDNARIYVEDHFGAMGMKSAKVGFFNGKTRYLSNRVIAHIKQTYNGVRVFGGTVIVQMDYSGGIRSLHADIMRDPRMLDLGTVSTIPSLSHGSAAQFAIDAVSADHPEDSFSSTDAGTLFIYDPSVVGQTGPIRLVWKLTIAGASGMVAEAVLVDAHTGEIALRYPLVYDAKARLIYDAANTSADPGTLVRAENSAPSGIVDADQAYDFYGDTYDFFLQTHGRDSIDDAGLTLSATVRYCDPFSECPFANAFWDGVGLRMYFGQGFSRADDIVAHELTHGVTQFESGLIYFAESGAINESFSDMWGEWVDLVNGDGTDTALTRWLMGEDEPTFGALRNMQDPTAKGDPDRLSSPFYWTSPLDNYGVHSNSGIGNKLCYLLTDGTVNEPGGQFNGKIVTPMGIRAGDIGPGPGVAELMYVVQTSLLSPASDYLDLGGAVQEAAIILGLSRAQRLNIQSALEAVEIVPETVSTFGGVRDFRAMHAAGDFNVQLTWTTFGEEFLNNIIVCQSTNSFVFQPTPETTIFQGLGVEQFTHGPLPIGTEVFYTLFVVQPFPPTNPLNPPVITDRIFARAVVGEATPDYQSNFFGEGELDLQNTQVLYSPSIDAEAGFAAGSLNGYVNYTNYDRTVVTGVNSLPVSKANSIPLPPTDDGVASFTLQNAVPFFGKTLRDVVVSPAGFLTDFSSIVSVDSVYNVTIIYDLELLSVPSLSAHFQVPRVAFLQGDLSPASTGERWLKFLDDRFVVTFEGIPERGFSAANTVQCEVFYSGHIRITYLDLSMRKSVIGLSDGRGIPWDFLRSNLKTNSTPDRLTFSPTGRLRAQVGVPFEFTITANVPPGAGTLTISQTQKPPNSTFVQTGNTAKLTWTPASGDTGTHVLRATAQTLAERITQDVIIIVTSTGTAPSATNLQVIPSNPTAEDFLSASFGPPSVFGSSPVIWFRNNSMLVPYFNSLTIPPSATQPGDVFYFAVIPSDGVLNGTPVFSDPVVIASGKSGDVNGDGAVNAADIQLVINGALNKELPAGADADINSDGQVNAADVQAVINAALA